MSRVLDLGASLLTGRPVAEDGLRWRVLADPDGNEFCVLQPVADSGRAALRALAAGPADREP